MRGTTESLQDWEDRVEGMNNKEFRAELRFYNRQTWHQGKPSLRDVAEVTALEVVFDSFLQGKLMHL